MRIVRSVADFKKYQDARNARNAQLTASQTPDLSFKVPKVNPNGDKGTADQPGLARFLEQTKGLCDQVLERQYWINSHAPNGELENLLLELGSSWDASSVRLVRQFMDDNPNAQVYHPLHIIEGSQLAKQKKELVFFRDEFSKPGFVTITIFTSKGRKTVTVRPNEESEVVAKNAFVPTELPSGRVLQTRSVKDKFLAFLYSMIKMD